MSSDEDEDMDMVDPFNKETNDGAADQDDSDAEQADEKPDSDDDDEDESEEDEPAPKSKKRKRKRGIRSARDFMDEDVVVDDEEEESEAEIDDRELEQARIEAEERRAKRRRELTAQLEKERNLGNDVAAEDDGGNFDHRAFDDRQAEAKIQQDHESFIQREASRRNNESYHDQEHEDGDEADLDEKRLLPDWRDPRLWMVQCQPGKEGEACVQLMRKYFKCQQEGKPLLIKSVIANPAPRNTMGKSYIYVEAHKITHVQEAIKGIHNLAYGQWKQTMVDVSHMTAVVQVVKPKRPIQKGDWVRMRTAPYKGDIAKVQNVFDQRGLIGVQVVPRIDYQRFETEARGGDKKKLRKTRPPQKLFDPQDVRDLKRRLQDEDYQFDEAVHSEEELDDEGAQKFTFAGKTYVNGLLLHTCASNRVDHDQIKPSIDELRMYERTMSDPLAASNATKENLFKKGDKVEVREGDLENLIGTVLSVEGREVTIMPTHQFLKDPLPFDFEALRKSFKNSDHVKVIGGHNEGETGIVVKIDEDIISVVSDLSRKEFRVRVEDLQLGSDIASGLDSLGMYELHDLVQLDPRTVGCVIRIERDLLFVLDQEGNVKQCKPVAVTSLSNRKPYTTIDSERQEVKRKSVVNVIQGPLKGQNGLVKHVWKSSVFIFKRDYMENNGIFVSRSKNLKLAGGKGRIRPKPGAFGYGAASPSIHGAATPGGGRGQQGRGGNAGRGRGGRRHRSEWLNKTIRVTRGPFKGYLGLVRNATPTTVKVELQAMPKHKIFTLNMIASVNDEQVSVEGRYESGSFGGSETPAYGSATPMHGNKTPMHGNATPSYGGGQTPGQDGSATPSRGDATPGLVQGSAWDPKLPNTPGGEGTTPGGWDPSDAQTPGWDQDSSVFESPYNPASDSYGTPATGQTPGTPGTPGVQPNTPSTPYDYNTGTPQDGYGGTPSSSYGGYDAGTTPSNEGMTPSAAYTPGTPNAMTPMAEDGSSWHQIGVFVKANDDTEGKIVEVDEEREKCTIQLNNLLTQTYNKNDLTALPPTKTDDTVIVLAKDFAGLTGNVLAFEGVEVIVSLQDSERGGVKIIEKAILAKYDPG